MEKPVFKFNEPRRKKNCSKSEAPFPKNLTEIAYSGEFWNSYFGELVANSFHIHDSSEMEALYNKVNIKIALSNYT